jgi:hypothetical protein
MPSWLGEHRIQPLVKVVRQIPARGWRFLAVTRLDPGLIACPFWGTKEKKYHHSFSQPGDAMTKDGARPLLCKQTELWRLRDPIEAKMSSYWRPLPNISGSGRSSSPLASVLATGALEARRHFADSRC